MDDENWEFFNGDGEQTIFNCFKAVLAQNQGDNDLMSPEFRDWVNEAVSEGFEWPRNTAFGNAFKYLREQYVDNVITNIRTHCESRLKKFFKMCVYELNDSILRRNIPFATLFDHIDIRNAMNYTYNGRNTCADIGAQRRLEILLDELKLCGAPDDCNIRDFVENDWFKSLRMWLQIQRHVHNFHLAFAHVYNSWDLFRKYPLNVTQPTYHGTTVIPEPPTISNFTAIPNCSFQRRHVRIDTDVLYRLLCETKQVPKKMGKYQAWINIKPEEFHRNPAGGWRLFFDVDKIVKMVKGKKAFDHQIVSDGVSVTVLYLKPIRPEPKISNEELVRRLAAGEFVYEAGVDPGMRTWNATVRRNVFTGGEVSKFNLVFYFKFWIL